MDTYSRQMETHGIQMNTICNEKHMDTHGRQIEVYGHRRKH